MKLAKSSKVALFMATAGMISVPVFVAPAFAEDVTPGYNHLIPLGIMTPDKTETSIGTLEFHDGRPTKETVQRVYDNLDFARGMETFLNFIPATSLEGIRRGMKQMNVTQANQVVIFDKLMDSGPLFLTGNTDTVYAMLILDLERDGPTVIEIPPNAGPGTVNDAYFRFVVDMGAPGPDKGKGGTYVILPPDYSGALKPTQGDETIEIEVGGNKKPVWIAQSTSYTNWVPLRGFLVDGKPDAASKMWRTGLKAYPLSKASNPPKMEFVNASGKVFNTIHDNNYEFYEELDHVIQKEPVSFLDPELRGLAASIGIMKGKKFAPDARMKKILIDAVAVGNATARAILFDPREDGAYLYEGSQWFTPFIGGDYRWLIDNGTGGRNLDARTMFFYGATVNTPAMALKMVGAGSQYAYNAKDKNGDFLDGSKVYKLNIPANVPAKDFWSVVAYDPQTRSELQTSQNYPSKNNKKDDLTVNKDGSIDLYFGPKAPKGHEKNWIETVPGKGWMVLIRLYGPLKPWFDKTWKPGDFEPLE
ncbi:DUF1254 domain-containing protein [Falsihalocynthiibacter sp. BN13B15]|uniref:DUF1254 domain-containing protein n=1 Tax=Falsihalocynthiibacter sp. BN13B15 TaxID=3240871 RepID=UPI00350EBF31